MRSTLLLRLVAATSGVAVAAVLATAYVASTSTSSELEREASRSLDDDLAIRDALVEYGVGAPTWDGVGETLARLATSSGRHVTMTTATGELLADADPDGTATPTQSLPGRLSGWPDRLGDPAALIDPLATLADGAELTPVLLSGTGIDGADGLLVPDILLQADDDATSADYRRRAGAPTACLSPDASAGWPPGAPTIPACAPATLADNALVDLQAQLARRVVTCVTGSGAGAWLGYDVQGVARVATAGDDMSLARYRGCAASVRADTFDDQVAPAALLYLAEPAGAQQSWIARAGGGRVVAALGVILAIALLVAVALAVRLARPVRRLTDAAQDMADGHRDVEVPVRGTDELARLGAAFNTMSTSISAAEAQRRRIVDDVAHELRSPLTTVRSSLEAAQDGIVSMDADLVASLLAETDRLQRLIDDLGDVAQAESGTLHLVREPVDLATLLAEVAHRSGVTVDVVGDVVVEGDAFRLRQVFTNLVDNAVRHTPAGGSVAVTCRPEPAGHVTVQVVDTGDGIAAADLPHVFDRFYRSDRSRDRTTGGSGLGLAICRHLAEAHGGSITATSIFGAGSTFTVTLPAAE